MAVITRLPLRHGPPGGLQTGHAESPDPKELERMTTLTADERRRIVDDYLDAVFGSHPSAVADKMRMGTPELPDDPAPDQVAAWVEIAELMRAPRLRRLQSGDGTTGAGGRTRARCRTVRGGQGGRRVRRPRSLCWSRPRLARSPRHSRAPRSHERQANGGPERVADRIEAFTDRRVGRY
ncbi:MAG: hypothetical protein ACRDWT_06730 [Jatrophihabitantaceae bacterium]